MAPATFEWPGGGALLREAGLASDDPQVSGKWQQVDDFGWLRAVQSPNW